MGYRPNEILNLAQPRWPIVAMIVLMLFSACMISSPRPAYATSPCDGITDYEKRMACEMCVYDGGIDCGKSAATGGTTTSPKGKKELDPVNVGPIKQPGGSIQPGSPQRPGGGSGKR